MLPSVVADELQGAVKQFLQNAFPMAHPYFQGARNGEPGHPTALIDDLTERKGALFKGPYLDVQLPFRRAEETPPFRHVQLPFKPFRHQQLAFARLSGAEPESTIIATGTGSGKTECFMYPVLEDALNRREPGIKTIIIYPMNALAADQARRFASEVSKLETKLTVGMYVGGTKDAPLTTHMSPEHVITDRETLRENPPDILLTNYKMLDFLLIRPEDKPLWRHNGPGTLKYLVVDELHTFDGAQGTDLACLIRRLKDRLQTGPDLACIGTSATMGSRNSDDLLHYASSVFATPFAGEALIREDRLSVNEYLHGDGSPGLSYFDWPTANDSRLDPANYRDAAQYVQEQAHLWFPELANETNPELAGLAAGSPDSAVQLGIRLRQHQAFHELLHTTTELTDTRELAATWARRFNLDSVRHAELLLTSLVALTAAARTRSGPAEAPVLAPLLHVREQLWLRELRRMVCSVPGDEGLPQLAFADDLSGPDQDLHLPLIHCRECHLAGWGAARQPGSAQLSTGLQGFYQTWFQHSDRAVLLIPAVEGADNLGQEQSFCPHCHRLVADPSAVTCSNPACGQPTIRVRVPDMTKQVQRHGAKTTVRDDRCPNCQAPNGLAIIGYRAATLLSVMANRLFGTPYNDDRKLIAFSDSVQDAAHRAGFLGGSSWRSLSRQALTRWLKEHGPATLTEMRERLPAYWEETLGSAERFAGTFTAQNMTWLQGYRHLEEHGTLAVGSDLPDLVRKRLAWECVHEFGQRGPLGRSLERTGNAAIGFDVEQLTAAVRRLAERLREETGMLESLPDERVVQFVTGWLHHIRSRGAIYVPELDSYLKYGGSSFVLSRPNFMPGFGPRRRPPAAVSLTHIADNFDALTGGSSRNWYQVWLGKLFRDDNMLVAAIQRQVYSLLLKTLEQTGWLSGHYLAARGESVYLLNPDRLYATTDVAAARCDTCRHQVHFSSSVARLYDGLTCLRVHCAGHLHAEELPAAPTSDYGITDPYRLVAHEHTGLLERELRENVEASFISGKEPWDYNVLSATPTLEMGIDIGALSTVFLCSVPPTQANYVQRIGRAGRRDGNSLAVTIANGRNHDLFFYADPAEMVAGDVATPGVFLRAQAVLERQLIAWCFDRWTATTAEPGAIPDKLRSALAAVGSQDETRFPYTLLNYISATRDELLKGFLSLFPELGAEAREYLGRFLEPGGGDSLEMRLLTRLLELSNERKALQRQVRQLRDRITRLEKEPQDEARDERIRAMQDERSALLGLLSSLSDQQTLNFLTDEGLLPNYAFPEEGVTLQSVILRSTAGEESGGRRYEKTTYKFQRSAQAALGELAPEATFYAVSHKLDIDRVDLSLTSPEQWRFCDRCHYSSSVSGSDEHSACPRCGSPQWANVGQKHELLRLRQVYSTVNERHSRITDDAEQRDPVFFNRQMLVNIPPDGPTNGLRLKSRELPFGFEYVPRAVLREVNFGQAGGERNVFTVAGEERPRRGFRLCRHCGTVQKSRPKRGEKLHTFTCELFEHPEKAEPEDFLESLFLYRELESEAVRILLPLSEIAHSDTELNSFVAALNLGLRLHYRGDVNHLQVTRMTEPATQDSGERIFLVIYDRIPGGTGYLKDLMRDPANLFDVLERAHAHLLGCVCNDEEGLDGCYRCLLAYRDSRHLPSISRAAAAQLLGRIIAERDATESIGNLSSISTNPLIESALEQRFIDALGRLEGAQLSRELHAGKPGSFLTLPGADGRPVAWHVEHQVHLGPADGVAVNTEVDVLLRPARDEPRTRPIAVYMDGWQYHRDIIHDDVKKRRAILASGGYWVVTLTWDDLPAANGTSKAVANDLLRAAEGTLAEILGRACPTTDLEPGNSMRLLERWLRSPGLPDEAGQAFALRHAFTHLQTNSSGRGKLARELEPVTTVDTIADLSVTDPETALGGQSASLSGSRSLTGLVVTLPMDNLHQALAAKDAAVALERLRCHLWLDDGDADQPPPETDLKIDWRAFWTAANYLQFIPGFSLASRQAVTAGGLAPLPGIYKEAAVSAGVADSGIDEAWQDVLELSVLDEHVLNGIRGLGVPAPEVGVDLTDDAGRVVLSGGEAELLWRDQGIVVTTGTEPRQLKGWTMIPTGDGLLDSLKTHLSGGAGRG